GANAGAYTEVFEVRPAADATFVSLTEIKDYLNIPLDKTTWDGELRDNIVCACTLVEFLCGAVARRSIVEYLDGGNGLNTRVIVRNRPLISVDEVVEVWADVPQTLTEVTMPDLTQ